MEEKKNIMRIIKIITDAILSIILIGGIAFIVLFFCGIEPFVVETGSMKPTIGVGSISFINKNVKYEDIKENDVIAFNIKSGKKVTHRAIKITEQGIETKGDANKSSDGVSTTKENYVGKNIFSIPKLGLIIKFFQTRGGMLVLAAIIIFILMIGLLTGSKTEEKEVKKDKKDKKGKHTKEQSDIDDSENEKTEKEDNVKKQNEKTDFNGDGTKKGDTIKDKTIKKEKIEMPVSKEEKQVLHNKKNKNYSKRIDEDSMQTGNNSEMLNIIKQEIEEEVIERKARRAKELKNKTNEEKNNKKKGKRFKN